MLSWSAVAKQGSAVLETLLPGTKHYRAIGRATILELVT